MAINFQFKIVQVHKLHLVQISPIFSLCRFHIYSRAQQNFYVLPFACNKLQNKKNLFFSLRSIYFFPSSPFDSHCELIFKSTTQTVTCRYWEHAVSCYSLHFMEPTSVHATIALVLCVIILVSKFYRKFGEKREMKIHKSLYHAYFWAFALDRHLLRNEKSRAQRYEAEDCMCCVELK